MEKDFLNSLINLNRFNAEKILKSYSETPEFIAENIIHPTLEEIGKQWENGFITLSQVYMAGKITENLITNLFPIKESNIKPTIAIATLEDYHLLGKRIVLSICRSAGFIIKDYGQSSLEDLVENVKKDNIKILLISVLMLRSALLVKELKKQIPGITIIVGGAPFRIDKNLYKEVGADYYGNNASDAIKILKELNHG